MSRSQPESSPPAVHPEVSVASEAPHTETQDHTALQLQSIGQLSAGIAHEINTPLQFVGDNLSFLRERFDGLLVYLDAIQKVVLAADSPIPAAIRQELEAQREDIDLDFTKARGPRAFERTLHGVERVVEIVAALKRFGHPSPQEPQPVDVNESIRTTLIIARNEYKYSADIASDLQDVPTILGHPGQLHQVLLNLIINATHAIQDTLDGERSRGTITISSTATERDVLIRVSDDGCGIPADKLDDVFARFFTTKAAGRGTGQGLAIVKTIVEDNHCGAVEIDSEVGVGTTVILTLPILPSDGCRL